MANQKRSWAEWDKKSKFRCLHYKYKEQLHWLKDFYPEKIDRLKQHLADVLAGDMLGDEEEILSLQAKIARLIDKFETTLKEIEGRELGHFKDRPEHGTLYYIDLDNGNDGADGLGTGTAWLTLAKYTTTTVRTKGDIAKVRANTDESMAVDLLFDESGDHDDYIEIRGCSIADDPWGDSSDVKPILTFGDNNAKPTFIADSFWKINRLVVKESGASNGVHINACHDLYFLDGEVRDYSGGSSAVKIYNQAYNMTFDGYVFIDNIATHVMIWTTLGCKFISCVFNGGPLGTARAIYTAMSEIEIIDSSFGQTTSHSSKDLDIAYGTIVKARNSLFDITPAVPSGCILLEEDAGGVYGAGKISVPTGTVTKDTGVKTGAATFSCKMEPGANCGPNDPLTLNNDSLIEFPFIIKCTASVEKTVTIKIRSLGTWGVYPTNTELYIEALYLDHAVNATRTKVASTQVLSHASNWVDFTVTFTPLQTGVAYVTVYLKKFEDAGDGCYVNGEAT